MGTFCRECGTYVVEGAYYNAVKKQWYIGTMCDCGPQSIDSVEHYDSFNEAEIARIENTWIRR